MSAPPETLDELQRRVAAALADGRRDVAARLLIRSARRMLYEDWEADRWSEMAALLRDNQQFGYARRLYRRRYTAPDASAELRDAIREPYALTVYKDLELPVSRRYDRALQILGDAGDMEGWSAESLGQAGAIYKRKWQAEAKLADLENSLACYELGYSRAGDPEQLYCGVNAAFVLDQLATVDQTDRIRAAPQEGEFRDRARTLRREIARALCARGDAVAGWEWATLAEAQFGLGHFRLARRSLERYVATHPAGWQRETTASQFAELGRLLGYGVDRGNPDHADQFADSPAAQALHVLVGDARSLLRRAYVGKVGLALSGGGFRASLYHIGVLAALAERDVLRGVEVLSCVSGGSILGAYYYLRERELLQRTPDAEITPEHYVALVEKLARDFLAGVQRNPRVRITGNVADTWRMVASSGYSRTNRIAELFQELLYRDAIPGERHDWRMDQLFVIPEGAGEGFSPRYDNWERMAKVPMLVLNATTLNTGHSWQFTASWMGEPPDVADESIDANPRLRRMYYADAPPPYKGAPPRLADAVGASACVPGLFPPVRLEGLYPDRVVELVDGGVHDNQGVASLIEQECGVMLVSDASGQMGERAAPGRTVLSVAGRSSSIQGSRVRGAELGDLQARRRGGALRRLMVVHLKLGLPVEQVGWLGCPEPYEDGMDERPPAQRTPYGIDDDTQRALADIRTDLDAFSDTEAYALMAAGYDMATRELDRELADFPPVCDGKWPFAAMLPRLAAPLAGDRELDMDLTVGKERFFKPLRRALWRGSRRAGASGKGALKTAAARAGHLVALPVRAIVGVPVALLAAAATRAYLATVGRVRH